METTLPVSESPLYRRLLALTVDVLDLTAEQVTPDTEFANDLGADSLDLVELVEALEAEFAIRIDDEELAEITTVGEAYDLVAGKIAA
jgi:acyl carrier protein